MRNYRKTTMHKHMLFPEDMCTTIKPYQTLYFLFFNEKEYQWQPAEILKLFKCVIFVSSIQSLSSLDVSFKPS